MTPRELQLHVEEYREKMQLEREQSIIQAYYTALFYRAKRMPSLNTVLRKIRTKPNEKSQTPDQMLAFVKRYMANLKGKE